MSLVHVNGEFVEAGDARVSAFDAGIQHGVGLFETMLALGPEPRVHRLGEHLERIRRSARELQLLERLDETALGDLILDTVARSGLVGDGGRARVRLTITGGDLNLRERGDRRAPHMPGVIISCQPATAYPDEMFATGVRVVVGDLRVNPLDPLCGHKTINYWSRLRELQRAHAGGASEALIFQVTNHLAGGSVSNVFVARDGRLRTPIARGEEEHGAIASPVLPGVTRGAVMEVAEEMGVEVERSMLSYQDLREADEVFLTNSSWGVLPVVAIEREVVGAGRPGDLTRALRARWLEELA